MSITLPQPYAPDMNPAVQHCLDAWQEVFDQQVANGKDDYSAARAAHKAYRLAMPNPDNDQTIRDFIARRLSPGGSAAECPRPLRTLDFGHLARSA